MKISMRILSAGILITSIQGVVFAQETQENSDKIIKFSKLKVSGVNKKTPLTDALAKPGGYSAIGTENSLQSLDQAIRSMPGVYTQMDASQAAISINIRGLSGFGRVNTMIDGVSQSFYGISPSQYTHGQQPYNQFGALIDPNFVVQVEVEKGQLNGGNSINALAGSANVRTLDLDDVVFKDNLAGVRSKASWGDNGTGYNGMVAVGGKTPLNQEQGYIGGLIAVSGHNIPGNYKNGNGNDSDEFATDSTFKQKPDSQLSKIKFKPNDYHELELSGRFYQNKLTRRKIDSKDYYLKYKYTPFSELIDSEILLSHSRSEQKFEGDSLGWALREGESNNQSDAINAFNTSRFSLGDIDYSLMVGSKIMQTKYDRVVNTVSTEDTLTRNPFSPQGSQDLTSAYTKLTANYDIYTAQFDLNYTRYHVKGFKPACDAREKCFPEGESNINLREAGLNPGVLLSAEIIPEFQPFVSYAHSMRAPNSQEAFFSNEGGASMNPFLKGEKAQTLQLGFNSFRPDLIVDGDQLRLKALWYNTRIKDYIHSAGYVLCRANPQDEYQRCLLNDDAFEQDINPNVKMYIYQNDPNRVTLKGYEIQADYDAGVFYTSLAYSKESSDQPMSATYGSSSFSAADISELPDYYLTLDSGVRLFDEKLTLGTTIRVTGPSKRINPAGDIDSEGAILTDKYEKQPTIIDLYADYTVNRNFKMMFMINNATNRNYSDALNRANSSAVMEETSKQNQTARGRTYMLGGQVRF